MRALDPGELPLLWISERAEHRAVELQHQLRSAHQHLDVPPLDYLPAAIAEDHGATILHYVADSDRLAAHSDLSAAVEVLAHSERCRDAEARWRALPPAPRRAAGFRDRRYTCGRVDNVPGSPRSAGSELHIGGTVIRLSFYTTARISTSGGSSARAQRFATRSG